jgi:two-component system chemotaxis response regulator CheB
MVIDDSAVVRQVICALLEKHADIEVIGSAPDPIFALRRMESNWPDVIVLDVEMPRMDGITFLKRVMQDRPTPTVICSSLTERGAQVTIEALAAGAVSILTKPSGGVGNFLREHERELVEAIRAASQANVAKLKLPQKPSARLNADAILAAPGPTRSMAKTTDRIIAMGMSTGGTQALEYVLRSMPRTSAGIVVVQHMPPAFTKSFAQRLDGLSDLSIKEAAQGDRILSGGVLIAPGGRHLIVRRNGAQYVVDVVDGPLVSRHRPSVDVLFRSVAKSAGANALGVLMTGMGDDGARGLKEMHDAGAHTVAQDEATSVVFGMPREAIRLGAADDVLGLPEIPQALLRFSS